MFWPKWCRSPKNKQCFDQNDVDLQRISNVLTKISNIGTEILYFQCFVTTDMFLFCKSIIFSGDCSARFAPLESSVKTRFKAFWDLFFENLYATLASQVTDFAQEGDLAWRNLAQYQHRSALHAPYFACAEIWYLPMFLAYQRASRPYKRVVFEVFSFCIF